MLKLQNYRTKAKGLPDLLPYALLCAPGIVLNKDGSFLAAWEIRGQDTDSSTPDERAYVSAQFGNAVKLLGTGWMLHVDAIRSSHRAYPGPGKGHFPDPVTMLIDDERRAYFDGEAIGVILGYAEDQGWPLPDAPRTWKAKGGAQEAHEAIRPTHIEHEGAGENEDERALYSLIRLRALASQLADAVYSVRVVRLSADLDGKEAVFEARGRVLVMQGWKVLLQEGATNEEGETELENPVPAMKPGARVTALSGNLLTKKTKPAPRYTEAALVRELEKRGIGRPSTYAAILDTLQSRGYVALEKRFLVPTPLGEKVIDGLAGRFSFADYGFTSGMEQALDDIASGKAEYRAVVSKAYENLHGELAAFFKATGKTCPKCGKAMVHRVKPGKGGYDFWGCSGYPDCKEKL